jgi:hypothetical protein
VTRISGTFTYQPASIVEESVRGLEQAYTAAIAAFLLVLNDDGSPVFSPESPAPADFAFAVGLSRPFDYPHPELTSVSFDFGLFGFVTISAKIYGEVPEYWAPLALWVILDETSVIITAAQDPAVNYGITKPAGGIAGGAPPFI